MRSYQKENSKVAEDTKKLVITERGSDAFYREVFNARFQKEIYPYLKENQIDVYIV